MLAILGKSCQKKIEELVISLSLVVDSNFSSRGFEKMDVSDNG